MNPELREQTWSGEVEIDLGDLGFCFAEAEIDYSHDGNTWYKGSHKLIAEIQGHKIDVSDRISDFALDDIFNQYIVNG